VAAGADKPRVLLVAEAPGRRPAQNPPVAELLAAGRRRYSFVVISSHVPPELRASVEWQWLPNIPGPLRLRWAAFALAATWLVRRRRGEVDLVHTVGPSPVVLGRVDLATLTFHWQGFDRAMRRQVSARRVGIERLGRWLMARLERHCYAPGRARRLSTLSRSARAEVAALLPGTRVELTGEGVDLARFAPDADARAALRSAAGVGDDEAVAVFVGRERRDTKGLELAMRAFAAARRNGGGPARLWVLGTGQRRWERLARELGASECMSILGFRSDLPRFLAAADIFVLPTIYEVSCRAAYEAAACGLPIVAPPVHGVAELVGDNQGGLLVPRDQRAVAYALRRLAEDAALRRALGDYARRRAVATAQGDFVPAVLDLYDQLIEADRAPR
jgi:glycosyltransferase involved in cell wall biosynthesis